MTNRLWETSAWGRARPFASCRAACLVALLGLGWASLVSCSPRTSRDAGADPDRASLGGTPDRYGTGARAPDPPPSPVAESDQTLRPQGEPVATARSAPLGEARARGLIIEGYGSHMPLYDLPIVVEARGRRLEARSDAEGRFEIAGLPVGLHAGSSSHLRFQVPVAEGVTIVELGTLKVPLTHPPSGWWWQPSELPSLAALAAEAEAIDFVGCFEDPGWRRPSRAEQARAVWSRGPFASEPPERLEAGFDRPGFLFTTVDRFMQSLPGGLDLGPLGAEQRFALGLWTGADPISGSTCDYRPATLDALVRGERLEVWLLGYRALAVRRRLRIFDPPVTPRVEGDKDGDPVVWSEARFAVYVEPAEGFSVIRFAGIDTSGSPLALHLIEGDRELAELSGLDP